MAKFQPSPYLLSEQNRLRRLGGDALYPDFRDVVVRHYDKHGIAWWGGSGGPPTNPDSSQLACINHLEPARLHHELALALAQNVQPKAAQVLPIEDGWLAYEWIGQASYLGERRWSEKSRGKYVTSLDALMPLKLDDGTVQLLVIEWKYTESYAVGESQATSDHGTSRVDIYRPLLDDPYCPIKAGDHERLFYDPFLQLMRQTLLAWQMVEHREFDATDWLHVTVIPEANVDLRSQVTSPGIAGADMGEAWRSVLKEPRRYLLVTPTDLIDAVVPAGAWRSWLRLRHRT